MSSTSCMTALWRPVDRRVPRQTLNAILSNQASSNSGSTPRCKERNT